MSNIKSYKYYLIEEPHVYLLGRGEEEVVYDLESEKGDWLERLSDFFRDKKIPNRLYKGVELPEIKLSKPQMRLALQNMLSQPFFLIAIASEFYKDTPNIPEGYWRNVPKQLRKAVEPYVKKQKQRTNSKA